jgi:hypothetical protein
MHALFLFPPNLVTAPVHLGILLMFLFYGFGTKDKSLGGEGTVQFNEQSAISVNTQGFDGYIVDGKLAHFEFVAPGACGWLIQTMDGMAGATACPGNRKTGKSKAGDTALYCASAGGRAVWIECSKGEHEYIEYTLGK